jgi:hypothetical protein
LHRNPHGENGYDLVVAAEDDGIHAVVGDLAASGVSVQPIQVDLRTPDGVEHLFRSTTRWPGKGSTR